MKATFSNFIKLWNRFHIDNQVEEIKSGIEFINTGEKITGHKVDVKRCLIHQFCYNKIEIETEPIIYRVSSEYEFQKIKQFIESIGLSVKLDLLSEYVEVPELKQGDKIYYNQLLSIKYDGQKYIVNWLDYHGGLGLRDLLKKLVIEHK